MIQTHKLSAITSIFFQNFSLIEGITKKKVHKGLFRNRDTANFISDYYCPELQNNTYFLDEEDKTIYLSFMQRSR